MSRIRYALAVLSVATLCACGLGSLSPKQSAAAISAIERFHLLYNQADYETIYKESNKIFRDNSPQDRYYSFMEAVHKKLGKHVAGVQQNWHVNYGTAGTTIVLLFNSVFEHGQGNETFTLLYKDGAVSVVGYNINSNDLITK